MLPGRPSHVRLVSPKAILGSLYHADFDAADAGISVSVGKVVSIPNRGADSGAMAQATAGLRPVYSATSFNGGPGMTFDGVSQAMLATFAAAIPIGSRPYMWLAFRQLDTTAADQAAAGFAPTSQYFAFYSSMPGTAQFGGIISSGGGYSKLGVRATETSNCHSGEIGYTTGGTAAITVDGVSVDVASGSSGTIAAAVTGVGAGYFPGFGQYGHCVLRRIIVANNEPSIAQRVAMRAYFRAQSYGLS